MKQTIAYIALASLYLPLVIHIAHGEAICHGNSNQYNCPDFKKNGINAQNCFDYCRSKGKGDIHRLDRDKDGEACESN